MNRSFIIIGLLLIAAPAWSAVICVPNATPGGCDSTQATVQAAVDNAVMDDTVRIAAGTFNEAVNVDKALLFEGAGAAATIVMPPVASSAFTVIGDLGAGSILSFTDIGFQGATESGINIGGGDIIDNLVISNCAFTANERNGLSIVDGSGVAAVTVQDSTFTGNGEPQGSSGDGDLLFFQFEGDANISNLIITGQDRGNGPGENGIQFRDDDGVLGAVTLNNVLIEGVYEKQPLAFFNYDDITGLSATDVVITADRTGFELAANFDGIGGTIDFRGLGIDTSSAPDPVALQGDVGDNTFIDGDGSNFFRGFAGDDTFELGPGEDFVAYVGEDADYLITDNNDGTLTVEDINPVSPPGLPDEGTDLIIFTQDFVIGFTSGDDIIIEAPFPNPLPVPALVGWSSLLLMVLMVMLAAAMVRRRSAAV